MNIQGLIERYEKFKASKKKLTSVDLVLKDLRSLDEPEPLPFKLKDVVGRIRGFDPSTQTRWLNDIFKELGGDYGRMKYRDGYEQGLLEGAWVGNQLKDADKIRQELNKVFLPEFMYDWIFDCQLLRNFSLSNALDSNTIHLYAKKSESVKKWLNDKNNQELFARAWIDDYEIEEESKYRVKLKNTDDYLNETEVGFHFYNNWENNKTFTRKELEYSDFNWVLDCPGIELVEV
nr:MAG TPA: Protein of unknown function (DUF1642) [Caudoviricetes sp.]